MMELIDNEIVRAVVVFLTSLVISYLSIPSIINVAHKKHLFDEPNGRTSHAVKTPTLGGIAIFASLLIALGLFVKPELLPGLQYLFASLTLIFFIGLKDDIMNISATKKLVAQLMAAGILAIFADIRLSDFHGFLGIHEVPYFISVLVTIIAVVGVINGFNLVDGIDGLASGIGIVTSLTFGIWFATAGSWQYFMISMALTGSLIAFFRFNVFSKQYKLFMGDTGSLILGLTVSVLMIRFNEMNIPGEAGALIQSAPAVSIGILVIPLFDTLRVMVTRILKGNSPFKPDKTHLHHYLLECGFSHLKSTLIIICCNVVVIALAFALQSIGTGLLFLVLLAVCIFATVLLVTVVKKRNEKKPARKMNHQMKKATVA